MSTEIPHGVSPAALGRSPAKMLGYVDTLRSISQGRANFHMEYDHYAPVETPDPGAYPAPAARRA
jgi:translation elongation factor EF-G